MPPASGELRAGRVELSTWARPRCRPQAACWLQSLTAAQGPSPAAPGMLSTVSHACSLGPGAWAMSHAWRGQRRVECSGKRVAPLGAEAASAPGGSGPLCWARVGAGGTVGWLLGSTGRTPWLPSRVPLLVIGPEGQGEAPPCVPGAWFPSAPSSGLPSVPRTQEPGAPPCPGATSCGGLVRHLRRSLASAGPRWGWSRWAGSAV